jgi:HPt (histidine-containing phosphotransfer) domain-containing protein
MPLFSVERHGIAGGAAHTDIEALVQYDFKLEFAFINQVKRAAVSVGEVFCGGEDVL